MRSSDWSSDVCSSDLVEAVDDAKAAPLALAMRDQRGAGRVVPRELAALEADFAACKGIEERQQQRPEAIFGARPHQRRTQELVRRQPALPVQIGRAHACTKGTNAHVVLRLQLEKQQEQP